MSKFPYNTQRWLRLRAFKLREHPLCQICLTVGRIEPATVVHHVVAISAGGDEYPALDKLESLCESCHNQVTQCERTGEDYRVKGCDVFGRPIDPNHPWNRDRQK